MISKLSKHYTETLPPTINALLSRLKPRKQRQLSFLVYRSGEQARQAKQKLEEQKLGKKKGESRAEQGMA